jgi:hypothetical protein
MTMEIVINEAGAARKGLQSLIIIIQHCSGGLVLLIFDSSSSMADANCN